MRLHLVPRRRENFSLQSPAATCAQTRSRRNGLRIPAAWRLRDLLRCRCRPCLEDQRHQLVAAVTSGNSREAGDTFRPSPCLADLRARAAILTRAAYLMAV